MRLFLLLLVLTSQLRAQSTAPEPAQTDEKPLPDVTLLIKEVETHERAAREIRTHYFYRETSVLEQVDSKDNTKKTERRVYECFMQDGAPVQRLVEKDGKPLSDKEKSDQDKEIDKQVQKYKERHEKGEDVITVDRILDLGSFTNPQRILYNGRPTITADYTGDPKARTRNRAEDMFKHLEGKVWIDEQMRTLVRGEGQFAEDFKIGGGLLVNIHKGLHFTFQERLVNNEIWLPADIFAEGSARVMLFVNFRGRQHVTFSDYKKYTTGATILPGALEVTPDGTPVPPPTEPPQPKP